MPLETQPCMTCGLHHRNRDFQPACMLALKARITSLEEALGRLEDELVSGGFTRDELLAIIRPVL